MSSALHKKLFFNKSKFVPNDYIDKFARVYLAIIFFSCMILRAMGVI